MNAYNDTIENFSARCLNEEINSERRMNTSEENEKNKSKGKAKNLIDKYNIKSLQNLEESDSNKNLSEFFKPPKIKSQNYEGTLNRNNSINSKSKSTLEKDFGKITCDTYFKTSASSNEGLKSQYQSTGEAITIFSPKEKVIGEFISTRTESNQNFELKFLNEKDKNLIKINTPNLLVNNIKLLYDQNTDRSKKRLQQMKKMSSNRPSGPTYHSEEIEVNDENILRGDSSQNLRKMNTQPNFMIHETNSHYNENTYNEKLHYEDSPSFNDMEENKEDAEVMISDLDIPIDEYENLTQNISPNILLNNNTKSFVPITNLLVTKNSIKEDNATPSYLLALSQYSMKNIIDEEEEFQMDDVDSVENNKIHSVKEVRHIRLPSGKNYLINSVILEEEFSENFTDSELSLKKKSFFMSKSKYGSSEKKMRTSRAGDAMIERNLENAFNMSNRDNILIVEDNYSNLYNSNKSRGASKSEVPYEFIETKMFNGGNENYNNNSSNNIFNKHISNPNKRKICHKVAKSEIFNIQIDLKKTLDEISRKKLEEDGLLKQKVGNKKKELMDMFFNKSNDNANFIESKHLLENINILNNSNKINNGSFFKNIQINVNNNNCNNSNSSSLSLKKSPQGKTREQYYQENSDKSKKVAKFDEENFSKIITSKEDFEMKLMSPMTKENNNNIDYLIEENLLTFNNESSNIIPNSNINNNINNVNNVNNNNTYNINFKEIKEKYKKERKKSSIFKSEDLRISKTESNLIFMSPRVQNNINSNIIPNFSNIQNSINEQCSYININNNFNICSPISVNSIINDKIVCDKTLINPFDLLRNNSSNKKSQSSSDRQNCINLNLTISNNKNEEYSNIFIRRRLFDNSEVELSSGFNQDNLINFNQTIIQPKVYQQMTISNEIHIDIINNKKEEIKKEIKKEFIKIEENLTKENHNNNPNKRNRKSSLEFFTRNTINSIQTIPPKHNKTASMQTNLLNEYKRSISGILTGMNIKTLFKKNNLETIKELKHNNSCKNNLFKRSNSNNSQKISDTSSVINTNNSHYVNTSPFNRNIITERNNIIKNKISPCNIKSRKVETPTMIKTKKASVPDVKTYLNFSNSTKKIKMNEEKKIQYSSVNVHNTANIPKQPKKTNSNKTISEIPILCNKLKIFEAMRFLFYKKTHNVDHHKSALEKLAKAKGPNFVILVEQNKQTIFEFKGVYEINYEKQLLLKIYSLNFCPNVIGFIEILNQFYFNVNTLSECKPSLGLATNLVGISIKGK